MNQAKEEIQQIVIDAWKKIFVENYLEVPVSIDCNSDFFKIGGHSMLATQMIFNLNEELNTNIQLKDFFADPTVASLSDLILNRSGSSPLKEFLREEEFQSGSISPYQSGIWRIEKKLPNTPLNNVITGLKIYGDLNEEYLEMSLNNLIERHTSLRMNFNVQGDYQYVGSDKEIRLIKKCLNGTFNKKKESIVNIAKELWKEEFNLENDVKLKAILIKLAHNESVLLLCSHHLVVDGVSSQILIKDLINFYKSYKNLDFPELPEHHANYLDYSRFIEKKINQIDEDVVSWKNRLRDGNSNLSFPVVNKAKSAGSLVHKRNTVNVDIEKKSLDSLERFCRGKGVSLFSLCLTAYMILLRRYSDSSSINIGTVLPNRIYPEVQNTVGQFSNNSVISSQISYDLYTGEVLENVNNSLKFALSYQEIPFDQLYSDLDSNLYETMIVFNHLNRSYYSDKDINIEKIELDNIRNVISISPLKIALNIERSESGMQVIFEFNNSKFEHETIKEMLNNYLEILNQISNPINKEYRVRDLLK